ncbi:MAG: MarR family transcriptional regulator [Christensenellaceae bacterium]|jgi:DNA-binding MarR family transcriptional regulator|nr:MarR family transcriptional regulator [Christensenellaceae bacterium]
MNKDESYEEIVIKLKKLIRKIEQKQADMDDCQITSAQARIIFPIIKNGKGYSMSELTEIAGVDKALVSRAISDLETKEIVERDKKSDSNERNYKINLTPKGNKIFSERLDKYRAEFERWRSKFTFEQLRTFRDVLDMLTEDEI